MVDTRALKRALVDSSNTLQHEGLREHMFSFVGAGHWWFAQVSRAWKMSYSRVKEHELTGLNIADEIVTFNCTAKMSLTRAAFASAACCSLATDPNTSGGLCLNDPSWRVQWLGGQFSDLNALRVAHERGLPATDNTLFGAAESGSLSKVQWLHEIRQSPLPARIEQWAATGGNLELLTCNEAATAGHEHVLRYLRERGCEWDEEATYLAAEHGRFPLVKWMISAGCPFNASDICEGAAKNGSVDMMEYARQHLGGELDARTMRAAANSGQLQMCQYLHANGCAWDMQAPHWAAYSGQPDTLRWLLEQGCPWEAADVSVLAAKSGLIEVMRYLLNELALATPALLQDMLNAAGAHEQLAATQWLRQQGAEWPDVLRYGDTAWSDTCLAWARQQGCTAPTEWEDDDFFYDE
jgi:Ankyrin repeats (many copies)